MSIPASYFVNVIPGVIGAGGQAIDLSAVVLTPTARIPIGTILTLNSTVAVQNYFGSNSIEAAIAAVYFQGPDNSLTKPGALLFSYYNQGFISGYLRGGPGLTLAQVNAITSGTFTITINGTMYTSSAINLGSAASFSAAASLLSTSLQAAAATSTATTIAGTTLTVGGTVSGTIQPGQSVIGTGVTAGTVIVSGSGNIWVVAPSQTVSSTNMEYGQVTITYDSIAGAFVINVNNPGVTGTITFASGAVATSLKWTAATGAVISQGAAGMTPASALNGIVALTTNWASFMTTQEPSASDKIAFASWLSTYPNRFAYVMWDTDVTVQSTFPATASAGYTIIADTISGAVMLSDPVGYLNAAAICGWAASLDFSAPNGRTDLAFTTQSGLVPGVTSGQAASNVNQNGYSFYGNTNSGNTSLNFFYNGSCTGPFLWADSYYDQIWMNNTFQIALLEFLTGVKSVPYNQVGYTMLRQALLSAIQAALNFGAIRTGVILSSSQIANVIALTGVQGAPAALQSNGWYLFIGDPGATVRAVRGSPVMIFIYTDGQSVQYLNLASLEIV